MTSTEEERQAMKIRFKHEGLDETMPDDKKLCHVWRWLVDAEFNEKSMRKQNEKLYKQQEADLKEVEEYIESLWKQSNNRLVELQTENRLLKQEIYNLKLAKPTELLDIMNNNKKNLLILNKQSENGEVPSVQPTDQKENKKSAFLNVKQMFKTSSAANKEQSNKQANLESELRFLFDKCRSIENEKKRLETENENLVFKLNETLAICDKLESSKASVQMARSSKSYYELRQATSEFGLNKADQNKLATSKTMNFQAINQDESNDNKSTSGVDSSSSQDKENEPIEMKNGDDPPKKTGTVEQSKRVHLAVDSGRESSSTLTDSRESKDFKDFANSKDMKEYCQEAENALRLMGAVRQECEILKKELIAKEKQLMNQEKQLAELQLKYDKRKARNREQIAKLKNHIERETKRWEKLFNTAKQKNGEIGNLNSNSNLVDSL